MLEKRLLLDRVGDEKLEIVPEVEAGGALSEDLAETCARAQNHLNYAVEKGKQAPAHQVILTPAMHFQAVLQVQNSFYGILTKIIRIVC